MTRKAAVGDQSNSRQPDMEQKRTCPKCSGELNPGDLYAAPKSVVEPANVSGYLRDGLNVR